MRNLWDDQEARACGGDLLKLRVYTSRLLGREADLVLHGGGNTSVKKTETNLFGEQEEILYVKGSGWDLATIEAEGFAPVRMDVLKKMAALDRLSDSEMVRWQRSAMIDPGAPNPSVEAILHAMIPFRFVDHTHADAVVTITNTPDGARRVREIYGDRVLVVPYVMPGFVLAKTVYALTRDLDWSRCEAMILMNHGVFTFSDEARTSYEKMIEVVTRAEDYLKAADAWEPWQKTSIPSLTLSGEETGDLARIRREVSMLRGCPVLTRLLTDEICRGFARRKDAADLARRGPLTPDHVIRTKRVAAVLDEDTGAGLRAFTEDYEAYFEEFASAGLRRLDPAPRWAVWKGKGILVFGTSVKELMILTDIVRHTVEAIERAEALERWQALPAKEIFDVEYWDLEQAKLKKAGQSPVFQGRVAVVTGAASGIGEACVRELLGRGAAVVALDVVKDIQEKFGSHHVLGMECDVTRQDQVEACLRRAVEVFGGVDLLVSNAGIFPQGRRIAEMPAGVWAKSLAINLTAHQQVLKACVPYLRLGREPAVVMMGSKNVPAPGPGAAAYSVAKAGLTQLARVAALELGADGIRVNVVHPNQVFDTAIWTDEVLQSRARQYGLTVQEYKTNNVLKTEVSARDVAVMVCAMLGPTFAKTTGAQVPVDGGNERVI